MRGNTSLRGDLGGDEDVLSGDGAVLDLGRQRSTNLVLVVVVEGAVDVTIAAGDGVLDGRLRVALHRLRKRACDVSVRAKSLNETFTSVLHVA